MSRRCLRVGAALLVAAVAESVCPVARADQDEASERIPSDAGGLYSPIEKSFKHMPPLPGGPRPEVLEEEVPPPDRSILLRDMKDRLRYADPFFRDMIANLYFRTQYLNRRNSDVSRSQAWAGGTALGVRSGWFDKWLQVEVAGATSQPLYAPEGEGGTLLLTDNQAEVSSLAIAHARMRGFGQDFVVGRQMIKTPYVNPEDTRMIPNSFEGAVLMREQDKAKTLDYGVGYLWGFKARDSSRFVPFSEALGLSEDRGIALGGFKVMPIEGLTIGAIDYYMADVLNTAFAEIDWITHKFAGGVQLRFSLNYTHQATVGEELLPEGSYATSQVSGRFAASYHDATVLAAYSANGEDGPISGPFGSFPAYTTLDQLNFNQAGERTFVIGAMYDFSHLITDGLKAQIRQGWGRGSVDPLTGAALPRQNEFNFELEYQPSAGPLENFQFLLFYSGVRMPGAPASEVDQPQWRSVITYLVPLL